LNPEPPTVIKGIIQALVDVKASLSYEETLGQVGGFMHPNAFDEYMQIQAEKIREEAERQRRRGGL